MIICISGYTGSGKTAIGKRLSELMKIRNVAKSYKDYVKEHTEVINFTKQASAKFAKAFDKEVINEANKGNCVVTTWFGPWLIKNATLRVWLNADENTRVKRKGIEIKKPFKEALKYVRERDSSTWKAGKKVYNIDLNKREIFDIEINTSKLSIDKSTALISLLALEKENKKFE